MKKIFIVAAVLLCSWGLAWADNYREATVSDILKEAKKLDQQKVEVKGLITSKGTVNTGKNKGYNYFILEDSGKSLQIRFDLGEKKLPSLNEKIALYGQVVHTSYGTYIKADKFRVTGKKKVESPNPMGMDKDQAKRLGEALKMLQRMQQLKRYQNQLERGMNQLQKNPQEVIKKVMPQVMQFLKEMGVSEYEVYRFMQKSQKSLKKIQSEAKKVMKDFQPILKKVQKELQKRMKKALEENQQFTPSSPPKKEDSFKKESSKDEKKDAPKKEEKKEEKKDSAKKDEKKEEKIEK